jgi:hypothetical protein
MRTLGLIEPQLLIVAALYRHESALVWARQQLDSCFGPIGLEGPTIAFHFTRYYEPSMGDNLKKVFFAFDRLQSPDQLAAIKRQTIDLEQALINTTPHAESRPLNLDPGFLGLGKFVLATTKDQAHRIYLHGGIFAEVTYRYHDGQFEPQHWTYPDWQDAQVVEFLHQARARFQQLRTLAHTDGLPPLLLSPLGR